MGNLGSEYGGRLKGLRKKAGYTQAQLAEKLNITPNAMSNYETGNRLMQTEMMVEVSQIFGCSLDYLLTGKEPTSRVTADDKFLEEALQLLSRMKKPVTRQMALKHLEIVLQVDEV